ncbi:MAG: hypothetical protein FWC15_07565 [Fibromonadales bacterium]|nr:hypothetical protein [Fibromonadales bacterium]
MNIGGKENSDVYLQSLDIQVEVTGNIASTRYTMVFKNKTDKILEGELTFPLPDGRTVTHYALDINGSMREAVPVEKARATQVFEEIQQRQVDPGILERVEGNNFRTRIYPIPANGARTISVGYEEELPLENDLLYYRLPMAYPDSLEKFAVKATVLKNSQKQVVYENNKPSNSLVFALPAPADIPQVIMQPAQGNHYFLASVAPKMEIRKKKWSDELSIIWDVSLSGFERNLQREIEILDIIFSENKNAKIHLYFLNNKLKKMATGSWSELKGILQAAIYDGGTDFSQINLNDIAGKEILFFSDGISTLSDEDFLKNTNRPVHSFVSSSKTDYSAMKLIAGRTKGKFVNINALSSENLKDELLNETLQFLGVEHGKEVREVYPSIAAPVYGNFSVAGISEKDDAEITLLFGFGSKAEKRIKTKLNASSHGNVHKIWAQKKIAELDLNYYKNRDELTELGKQFGIVTRNTSLMVLEFISDYVHYGIEPPPELQAEYQRSLKWNGEQQGSFDRNILEDAVTAVGNLKRWWDIDFSSSPKKNDKVKSKKGDIMLMRTEGGSSAICQAKSNEELTIVKMYDKHILVRSSCGQGFVNNSDVEVVLQSSGDKGKNIESVDVVGWMDNPSAVFLLEGPAYGYGSGGSGGYSETMGAVQPTITIKPIKKDNEYLKKLTGKAAEDYQIYLTLRNDYANSPTFYFDMADWFYKLGDKETALRILTSISELEIENAAHYRMLGYRFKEYGEFALQKFMYKKIIQWRPKEPQGYRDYALALADNGEMQAALDSLYGVLTRTYSDNIRRRSRGIEEVVATEINNLIAKNQHLNISKIDSRLIMNIPVDVRVVMNWNKNNSIIDVYVKDPNGEEAYYRNQRTRIGGRMSQDNMSGYGPEQFMLKNAIKGKYLVSVNYYSSREFAAAVPPTVMAEIYIKYSDKTEQRRVVSLQLMDANMSGKKKVEFAEFEF